VILKSAIYEDPFKPQQKSASELVRGIGAGEYPILLGYVATTPKPRAEIPLWTDKAIRLLAHWQYGLGRAVAFHLRCAGEVGPGWLGWDKYQQFWSQIAQWSCDVWKTRISTTDVSVDQGEGQISVEALDEQGNYPQFPRPESGGGRSAGGKDDGAAGTEPGPGITKRIFQRARWAPIS